MIELGKGWSSYLDAIQIEKDRYLHHNDEQISYEFVSLDCGADDTYVSQHSYYLDCRGLSVIRSWMHYQFNLIPQGTNARDGYFSIFGALQRNRYHKVDDKKCVNCGDAKMQGCIDEVGGRFYDCGGADNQTTLRDSEYVYEKGTLDTEMSKEKPTGTWQSGYIGMIATNTQVSKNKYIAESRNRNIKPTTVNVSVRSFEYDPYMVIKKASKSDSTYFEIRLPVFFKETCNFYNFDGVRYSRNGSKILVSGAWGFVHDGMMVIYAIAPAHNLAEEDISLVENTTFTLNSYTIS